MSPETLSALATAAVLAVAAIGLLPMQEALAAGTQQYRTEVRTMCYNQPGSGTAAFQLIKTGQVIGSATLNCGDTAFITTNAKPLEWKITITLKDANGNIISTNTTAGKDFPASSSLQGMFTYVKVPIRL